MVVIHAEEQEVKNVILTGACTVPFTWKFGSVVREQLDAIRVDTPIYLVYPSISPYSTA